MKSRTILFLTGTRADFSKIRPLIEATEHSSPHHVKVFVTGMHMLSQYGSTHLEVDSERWDTYKFVNHSPGDADYVILSKTISGLGDYVQNYKPDLIIVHGDRLEALAGALVGAATNTLVGHVEGGELSGTVDDSYRHAITKLSHLHFVSNSAAKSNLLQMGEADTTIMVIGSPELDLMNSKDLPSLDQVRAHYSIPFSDFGIAIFHPVVTELDSTRLHAANFFRALHLEGGNWVVIESNNDRGSDGVREELKSLTGSRFRILPSMRYTHFLTLLRSCQVFAGNSSTGVREAPHYGVPSVNVGTRQNGRTSSTMVVNCSYSLEDVRSAIRTARSMSRTCDQQFGDGKSAERFSAAINSTEIFDTPIQKQFKVIQQ